MDAYDVDFHAWAIAQADAIRRRSANEIDWKNLAEEVESVGRSERRSLRSQLIVLCVHLLKWTLQPERRGRSWYKSIQSARTEIPGILEDSPSLQPELPELFARAYALARPEAADEMHMVARHVPADPPFTLEQALGRRWPEDLVGWEPEWRE